MQLTKELDELKRKNKGHGTVLETHEVSKGELSLITDIFKTFRGIIYSYCCLFKNRVMYAANFICCTIVGQALRAFQEENAFLTTQLKRCKNGKRPRQSKSFAKQVQKQEAKLVCGLYIYYILFLVFCHS